MSQSSKTLVTKDPLERLRGFRVYPQRARGLNNELEHTMRSLRLVSHNEQAAIEAWDTVVPDAIGNTSQAMGLDRGKLIVTIPSAAMRYKTDNWLRGGGLRELQSLARVPIRGVQMKIVPQHTDARTDPAPGSLRTSTQTDEHTHSPD